MEKILILGVYDINYVAGAEKYNLELTKILSNKYQITHKFLYWTGHGKKNNDCLFYKWFDKNFVTRIISLFIFKIYIWFHIKKNKYSKVIINSNMLSTFKCCPEIISVQHNDFRVISGNKINNNVKKFLMILPSFYIADKIVCFDDESIELFRKHINKNAVYYKLPLYIDHYGITTEKILDKFIFIGRNSKQKRIDILNDVSKMLNNPIDVIGNFDEKSKQKYQYLNYLGSKTREEITKNVSNYKAVILTSDYEGLPFVFLEAMSCGVPIICRDTFITAKFLINNGMNGVLIDKNKTPQEIADIINNTDFSKFNRKNIGNVSSFGETLNKK